MVWQSLFFFPECYLTKFFRSSHLRPALSCDLGYQKKWIPLGEKGKKRKWFWNEVICLLWKSVSLQEEKWGRRKFGEVDRGGWGDEWMKRRESKWKDVKGKRNCRNGRMREGNSKRMNERMREWKNKRMNERMGEGNSKRINERMRVGNSWRMSERMREWIRGRWNEIVREWMKGWGRK